MTFSSGVLVYVMWWVIVLFIVLPWGVRIPERAERGHATSAPEKPYIGLKLLATSLLAGALWGVSFLILQNK